MQSTKSLGAIYTPNSVALSMCKSVLVDYICGEIDCFYKSYNDLVKEENDQQQRSIIQNLRQIRVLDPACGDGHFLLAMLVILEEIYLKFKKKNPSSVPYSESEIREHIILNSLFGVDVFPEAVKACKVKLSCMMAKKDGSSELIPSHPHIDLNIRNGNSVLGLYARGKPKLTDLFEKSTSSIIEERNNLVKAYEKATGDRKAVKRRELLKKTEQWSLTFTEGLLSKEGLEIIGSKYTAEQFNEKFKPFHWIMEFSQIFGTLKRGFDIIIGNPPYVKADSQDEGFQEYRKITGKLFGTFEEKWDLYIAFLELGLRLLKPRGVLSFIISDSFSTAKYASKMRRLLLSKKVLSVSFFPNIKIFQDVGIQNIIITVRNEKRDEKHQTKRITHESVNELRSVEIVKPSKLGENLFRDIKRPNILFAPEMRNTIPLGDICYISKGMVLNSDEKRYKAEFRKKDLISASKSKIHCKPYVENKLIREFCILKHKYLEYGTDRVPAKVSRPTFPELYTNEKIFVGKMGGRAVHDDQCMFSNDSLMVVIPFHKLLGVHNRVLKRKTIAKGLSKGSKLSPSYDLRYLLGILNSSHAISFFNSIRSHRLKNYVNPNELKQLPIVKATREQQKKIIAIVKNLEENRKRRWEKDKEKDRDKLDREYEKLYDSLSKAIENLYQQGRDFVT